MIARRPLLPAALLLLAAAVGGCSRLPAGGAQAGATPAPGPFGATSAAVTAVDLQARLTAFAHDSMRGRRAFNEDGRRAARIIAAEVARLGLRPAGDSGGYLQRVQPGASDTLYGYNVVAVLPGSDPKLAGQYVAFGAHLDHVGIRRQGAVDHDSIVAFNMVVRPMGADDGQKQARPEDWPLIRAKLDSLRRLRPARPDSINNGADDDGSGSVALMELAERFARDPVAPKRSLIFVWHTGEEYGMVGSRWYTDHPTVPLDSIVTQLNIDMIGRGTVQDLPAKGGPQYVELIGSRRLSSELGALVEEVNRKWDMGFRFNYEYDAAGHPEQYYCRSDHYMYARFGIPVTFFSTGSHRDYHMVTDEAQYIDYRKLQRVTSLIGEVGLAVANLDHRPVVDGPKPDPRGRCVQ